MRCSVVTVSDRCSAGVAVDNAGPAAAAVLIRSLRGCSVDISVVPDEVESIRSAVTSALKSGSTIVLTCGGTGFSPRDRTPEAVSPLLQYELPSLIFRLIKESLKITPLGWLARPVAGVVGESLVVTTPGSTKAAAEYASMIMTAIRESPTFRATLKIHEDILIPQTETVEAQALGT